MRLGIDFGTTRVVVAAVDRGNYPVVTFDGPEGASWDWYPPLIAVRGAERLYGWDAWSAQTDPQATIVRSVKRLLQDAGPRTEVAINGQTLPLLTWLSEMFCDLRSTLIDRSSLNPRAGASLQAMLGVPANANSNQRFLTVEACRAAGFEVIGLLNEPSAASVEFGHRNRAARDVAERLLVYDLGGGTFDASLVDVDERTHSVVASEGIPTLGGDDFDDILGEMALQAAGLTVEQRDTITQAEHFRLLEECREKKEAIHPNTRRIVVDLDRVREGWGQATVQAADFYERCRPMVEETAHAIDDLLSRSGGQVDALYVTGGGSELPLVARVLRETYGRRVKRSAHTRSATAIGLAIQADAQSGYELREKFTRNFGVWREAEAGREIVFDALFDKGTPLPAPGEEPLVRSRQYLAVHNVGHFRYLECSHRGGDGRPIGDITHWDEIRFPFDPALSAEEHLDHVPVTHSAHPQQQRIEESYLCDAGGTVTVTISNLTSGYHREYRLGRWSSKETALTPGRKRRARRAL